MKILSLITGFEVGGAQKQLFMVEEVLRNRGHQVQLVSITPVEVNSLTQAVNRKILSLGIKRGCPDIRAVPRLLKIVDSFNPDIIHAHMFHANLLARSIRIFRSQPVIVGTYHNISEGGIHRDLLLRFTDPLSDCLSHVCAKSSRRRILCPARKSVLIHNGIELDRFPTTPPEPEKLRARLGMEGFVWLAVARLYRQKNYECMLQAFNEVRNVNPHVRLIILGEGPERAKLERLIVLLNLTEFVELRGETGDVDLYYLAADGLVLSSDKEGLPIVALEAGLAKLPIVSTDVGGVSEIVADDSMGLLVPAKNPKALAEAMIKVMKMGPEKRAELGTNVRNWIEEKFSLENAVSEWERLYTRLLERKHRGHRNAE